MRYKVSHRKEAFANVKAMVIILFYQAEHIGSSENFKIEKGENFSFPLHLHQSFEIILVLEGEMRVLVDDRSYDLKAGNAVLVFPHQLHSLASTKCRHKVYIFSPELVKAYSSKHITEIPSDNLFSPTKNLFLFFSDIDNDASLLRKKSLLYSLCDEFDHDAVYRSRDDQPGNVLHTIFGFVEDNYKNDCSLYMLAAKSGYSYSYLSRYFKKMTGISYNEYVNQYRIGKACYLLSNTACSTVECAYEAGYRSLRNFNRNFKIYTNSTPQEYRRN